MSILPVSIASMVGTVLEMMNIRNRRDPLSLWFLFGIATVVTDTKIFQQYMVLMKKGIRRMLWRFSRLKKPPSDIFPGTPLYVRYRLTRKLITKIRLQNSSCYTNSAEFTKGHRCQLEWKDDESGCSGGYLWFSAAEKTTEGRGPDRTVCVNVLQTTDDLQSEVDEDHHGEHDEEVLEERDEGDGGG